MKFINKVIKTIIFLPFKKSQFLFSKKRPFTFPWNYFYKNFDMPLT